MQKKRRKYFNTQRTTSHWPYNIRVNALCPGFTKTKLTEGLLKDENVLSDLQSLHPMGRLAKPEEIANAALFLSSDEASFITGVCLPVDGGYTAQ